MTLFKSVYYLTEDADHKHIQSKHHLASNLLVLWLLSSAMMPPLP